MSASDIQYSNPVKSKNSVINALKRGVNWFAIDNKEELIKISSLDSDTKLCLRIDVPNIGSDWPLDEKFGATEADVEAIISSAHSVGSNIAGVTKSLKQKFINLISSDKVEVCILSNEIEQCSNYKSIDVAAKAACDKTK